MNESGKPKDEREVEMDMENHLKLIKSVLQASSGNAPVMAHINAGIILLPCCFALIFFL